ncbi:MAG: HAD family hydrolase [Acidimicrobiales bacterium]
MQPAPARRPRLMATDLDGTLLRRDGSLGERTIAAIASWEQAGGMVVLATGRPPRWVWDIGAQLGNQGLAVCANGSMVYDLGRQELVSTQTMVAEHATQIIARLRDEWPAVAFAVETATHLGLEPAWEVNFEPPEGTRFADVLELIEVPVIKLLARLDSGPMPDRTVMEATLARLSQEFDGLTELTWSGGSYLLEMGAVGVSKAVALDELTRSLGIEVADTIAFGDMPNDVAMLRWAGRGLAVANAHQLAIDAADEVIASNEEEGVAQYLETLLTRS